MTMREHNFTSAKVQCAAWHVAASTDDLESAAGKPCVVMAHGFGGTRDTALLPYAEGFASAGIDVLLFDYRGFGTSGGTPRQHVSHRRQREDYRAAISAARALDGVDPGRIVLWGTSYSGGHVLSVAAKDRGVAAVVSLTPATDGLAAILEIARTGGPARLRSLIVNGLRDLLRAVTRRPPHLVPVVGPPGSNAIIANEGAEAGYLAVAGPTWRNEVCARVALGVAFNRPIRDVSRLVCPLLVQIGDLDSVAPPTAAHAAAARATTHAEVRCYPVDHFDVYGDPWQQRVVADQVAFLRRHLATRTTFDNQGVAA